MRIRETVLALTLAACSAALACSDSESTAPLDEEVLSTGSGDGDRSSRDSSIRRPPPPPPPPPRQPPDTGRRPYNGPVTVYGIVYGVTARQPPDSRDSLQREPLANVLLQAERREGVVAETRSNARGQYRFVQLPAGSYRLRAQAPEGSGYQDGSASVPGSRPEVRVDIYLRRGRR